jgi:adenylate cyclase
MLSSVGPEEFAAAGLYDPDADDAPGRLALLEYLVSLGATFDDLTSMPVDQLPILAFDLALWPTRERLTLQEVAARAGVEPEFVARIWRTAGLAAPEDEPVFVPEDVELVSLLIAASTFLGEDVVHQLGRVIGTAAAQIADASISAFVSSAGPAAYAQEQGALELARANALGAAFFDSFGPAFTTLLRHHVVVLRRPTSAMVSGIDIVERTVGFVDQVDSTQLIERLDAPELASALAEFDSTAADLVVTGRGRLVKLIGDEIMYVADDAECAASIAASLIEAFAKHPVLPPVRAALASGQVVARDGDVFGAVVTRAARAVSVADTGEVVVDDATRDALGAGFVASDPQVLTLKGFSEPVRLWKITRTS